MNILYIDDDIDDSEIFLEAVKKIDLIIVCTVAHNGIDALRMISEVCPAYIFLDYLMPRMDGVKVLREIKKSECNAKVIMYSDFLNQSYMAECREVGAFDCWQKFASINELGLRLENLFTQDAFLGEVRV